MTKLPSLGNSQSRKRAGCKQNKTKKKNKGKHETRNTQAKRQAGRKRRDLRTNDQRVEHGRTSKTIENVFRKERWEEHVQQNLLIPRRKHQKMLCPTPQSDSGIMKLAGIDVIEEHENKAQVWANRLSPRGNKSALPPLHLNQNDVEILQTQTMLKIGGIRPVRLGERLELVKTRPSTKELQKRENKVFDEILGFDPIARERYLAQKAIEFRFNGREKELSFAAIILQAFWRVVVAKRTVIRKRLELVHRNCQAAITIQACFRAHVARKATQKLRVERKQETSATMIASIWRGYVGRRSARDRRIELERMEKQRQGATVFQSVGRAFLARRHIENLHSSAIKIQSCARRQAAYKTAAQRRTASHRIGRFARLVVERMRFLNMLQSILDLQCFWRVVRAKATARALSEMRQKEEQTSRERFAAIRIQALARRRIAQSLIREKRQRCDLFRLALDRQDVQLVVAHIVKGGFCGTVTYMVERYRDAMLHSPESAVLLYGRSLLASFGEKDLTLAKSFANQAMALDDASMYQYGLIQHVLKMGIQLGKSPGITRVHQGLLLLLCEPQQKELEAMTAFEDGINRLERGEKNSTDVPSSVLESAKRVAESHLNKYHREVACGSFQNTVFEGRPATISGQHGSLTCWKRGLNFRFLFTFLHTEKESSDLQHSRRRTTIGEDGRKKDNNTNKIEARPTRRSMAGSKSLKVRSKTVKAEIILTTDRIRQILAQLDKRELANVANHQRLVETLTMMITLVDFSRLEIAFKQDPFLKLTHVAPSSKAFLAVVVFPSDPSSNYPTDLTITARDDVAEEEYTLKVTKAKVEQLFQDEPYLLNARFRAGWRRICRPLISRLIRLVDVVDHDIPVVGDIVLAIDPVWRIQRENELKRGFSIQASLESNAEKSTQQETQSNAASAQNKALPRWYRVGKVIERQNFRFLVAEMRERRPAGSLQFRPPEDGRPDKTFWATWQEIRVCKTRPISEESPKLTKHTKHTKQDRQPTVELLAPRVRIAEVPDIAKPFRPYPTKRKILLCTEERLCDAHRNVCAMKIQSMVRGKAARSLGHRLFLSKCADRIASTWKWRVVLQKRAKVLAAEYRANQAATRLQIAWRASVGRALARDRLRQCFGTSERRKAFKLLTYIQTRGFLAPHALQILSRSHSAGSVRALYTDLVDKYKQALETDPFHPDFVCGYILLQGVLTLVEDSSLLVHHEPSNVFVNADSRETFRTSFASYFETAALVFCESPIAFVQVSVGYREVFHDSLRAKAFARVAKSAFLQTRSRASKSMQEYLGKLVEENLRRSTLFHLHCQCAARRIQYRWQSGQKQQGNVKLNYAQLCAKLFDLRKRKAVGSLKHIRRAMLLRRAWSLHARLVDPAKAMESYKEALFLSETKSHHDDILCCIALLSIGAGFLESDVLVEMDRHLIRIAKNTLAKFKSRFLVSMNHRFLKILENLSMSHGLDVSVLVNLAIVRGVVAHDREAAFRLLEEGTKQDPTSLMIMNAREFLITM